MPKVSAIVTTYNREDLLKETLMSILNQTFIDFELIVVDNFSDYNFFKLIENINDHRIIAFQNENEGVIAKNRNFAMNIAKGDFIAFCDDDDNWKPNKLQVQIDYIYEKNLQEEQFVIFTNSLLIYPTFSKVSRSKEIRDIDDFIFSNQICFSSTMISTLLLKEKFNENDPFIAAEDYLFWMNLKLKNYNFFLIKDPLITIKVNEMSMSLKNYGLNHISSILVLVHVYLQNNSKINSLSLGFSIMKEVSKFIIKSLINSFKK